MNWESVFAFQILGIWREKLLFNMSTSLLSNKIGVWFKLHLIALMFSSFVKPKLSKKLSNAYVSLYLACSRVSKIIFAFFFVVSLLNYVGSSIFVFLIGGKGKLNLHWTFYFLQALVWWRCWIVLRSFASILESDNKYISTLSSISTFVFLQ